VKVPDHLPLLPQAAVNASQKHVQDFQINQ
jgi:hypothetical protein